jgi:hypothetical protein
MRTAINYLFFLFLLLGVQGVMYGQISPGDLSKAHEHLEGISNCTQCHILNEKEVPNSKCLACHKEIGNLIGEKRGYHSSSEVAEKACVSCHNEHHGKDFRIINFEEKKFDHNLTSFVLEGVHSTLNCTQCHTKDHIKEKNSQRTTWISYLGLKNECFNCHEDFHQGTLDNDCSSCHGFDSFIPATSFNHEDSEYPLVGAHQKVNCVDCHPMETRNGKDFQKFAGISYSSCTDCHKDVHKGKFGNDCLKCHTMDSFHGAQKSSAFNHENTNYPLRGKHQTVDCKACHKQSLTDPLKYKYCTDCHVDYHNGQFTAQGKQPDCDACHTVDGYTPSTYTLEKHNHSQFVLKGGHLATPCLSCHKKGLHWEFRDIGKRCSDCHDDVHKGYIDKKYYPNKECENCHSEKEWSSVVFDHNKTSFELLGEHATLLCSECHYPKTNEGTVVQRFSTLTPDCENCHTDVHLGQFKEGDQNGCLACHGYDDWKADKFDHSKTRFKLEGGHKGVACEKCHKEISTDKGLVVKYKFEEIKCSDCHSPQE